MTARLLLGEALFLLVIPLCMPGIVYARGWFRHTVHSRVLLEGSSFLLVEDEDLEFHKEIIRSQVNVQDSGLMHLISEKGSSIGLTIHVIGDKKSCSDTFISKNQLAMLGEEHPAKLLVRRLDFWLYYIAYFCGGMIGLVYSNNLGQIAQSLNKSSDTTVLITLYSSFSFFFFLPPRTMSVRKYFYSKENLLCKNRLADSGARADPVSLLLLASSRSVMALHMATTLIGLSSGYIFAAAVSVTSELFEPNSVRVNHNILITNIPLGSLLYGMLAAIVFDANTSSTSFIGMMVMDSSTICMGRNCYFLSFVLWGCLSVVGIGSNFLLFWRTKPA